jgi:tetraacyldisaccharide 4'-kinase
VLRPPAFWRHGVRSPWPALLAPVGAAVAAVTAQRIAQPGWRAPVPVICCGNVSVGGAGKTTLALDLVGRLHARGIAVHALLRGYGGTMRGVHRVVPADPVALVGDEALLLAEVAPTWIGADRAASARAAVAAGAEALVLDDGLQNPTLVKTLALLVVDGGSGFGNGRVLPAGPLREPVAAGAARCQAAVLIGADKTGVAAGLPHGLTVLRARLEQTPQIAGLVGQHVFAFAGIARPEKFFDGLECAEIIVVGRRAFADHHPYSVIEIDDVLETARRLQATVVTTPKDAVRLPIAHRRLVTVVGVRLVWDDDTAIERLLDAAISGSAQPRSSGC